MKGSYLLTSLLLLATSSTAWAQAEQAAQQQSLGGALFQMLPMFVVVFLIFYLMVIRPQEKKLRAQQDLINSLKKGEVVVTSSGIIARVAGIQKDHILLEVSNNVKIKVEPSHVVRRRTTESEQKKAA